MRVSPIYKDKLNDCCEQYSQFILQNPEQFLSGARFNYIKYMNHSMHLKELDITERLYIYLRKLTVHNKLSVFLDFNVGPGFLETCNKIYKKSINMSTVDFKDDAQICSSIRNFYDLSPINYYSTNILEDSFIIEKCKTVFSYIILRNFITRWNVKDIKQILLKLKPYAKRVLIFENVANLTEEQKTFLNLESSNVINIFKEWNVFLIKINKLKNESV